MTAQVKTSTCTPCTDVTPDLLEAVEALLLAAEVDGVPDGWGSVIDRAKAALAKAGGR